MRSRSANRSSSGTTPRHVTAATLDRMHRLTQRSWNDDRDAAQRAEITRTGQAARNTPRAIQARIERLEKKRLRSPAGSTAPHTFAGGYVETTPPATGARLEQLTAERGQVDGQLTHWRGVLAVLIGHVG